MYLLERKSKTLYSQGLGTMVTNDWCINGEAIIKQGSDSINPGPAGPVSIRFHYACLCGGGRIDPGSPGK